MSWLCTSVGQSSCKLSSFKSLSHLLSKDEKTSLFSTKSSSPFLSSFSGKDKTMVSSLAIFSCSFTSPVSSTAHSCGTDSSCCPLPWFPPSSPSAFSSSPKAGKTSPLSTQSFSRFLSSLSGKDKTMVSSLAIFSCSFTSPVSSTAHSCGTDSSCCPLPWFPPSSPSAFSSSCCAPNTSFSSSISFFTLASSPSANSLCLTAFASLNVRVHICCVFKLFTSLPAFFSCSSCSLRVVTSVRSSEIILSKTSTFDGLSFFPELLKSSGFSMSCEKQNLTANYH